MPSPPARTHRICAPQLVPPESTVLPGTVSHTAWLHVESPQRSQYDGGGGGGGDGDGDGGGDGGDGELPHAAQVARQPTRSLLWYRPFSHRLLQLAVHSSLDSPSSKMNRQAQPHPEPSPSAHEPPWA